MGRHGASVITQQFAKDMHGLALRTMFNEDVRGLRSPPLMQPFLMLLLFRQPASSSPILCTKSLHQKSALSSAVCIISDLHICMATQFHAVHTWSFSLFGVIPDHHPIIHIVLWFAIQVPIQHRQLCGGRRTARHWHPELRRAE